MLVVLFLHHSFSLVLLTKNNVLSFFCLSLPMHPFPSNICWETLSKHWIKRIIRSKEDIHSKDIESELKNTQNQEVNIRCEQKRSDWCIYRDKCLQYKWVDVCTMFITLLLWGFLIEHESLSGRAHRTYCNIDVLLLYGLCLWSLLHSKEGCCVGLVDHLVCPMSFYV